MNISYNWLRELTDTALAPREVAERLTMVGLAVDTVHEAGDDFILEFDITSNRPDCLSHLGVARELIVIERGRVRLPEVKLVSEEGRAEQLSAVEIREPVLCPRYTARIVRGVRVAPSPGWLADRLRVIGQRPINNVADITNYVMHEMGQPLHAFDLAKLTERRIIVRRALNGERLKTLDGVIRELDEEMLIIADAVRPVALAGVMGGEETEVTDATRDVLIESAYFNPASVRRTARLLGLHTEASHRFERGVDFDGVLRAQARVIALVCEIAGGTATEDAIDVRAEGIESTPPVTLRLSRVKALTGLEVPSDDVTRILDALGFIPVATNGESETARTMSVNAARVNETATGDAESLAEAVTATGTYQLALSFAAPTWRVDIEREEDLVEEVARHFGYEKIVDALPAANVAGGYRAGDARRRAARRALTASGFDETISFGFIDAEHDGRFELLPDLNSADGNNSEGHNGESDAGGADIDGAEESLVTLSNPIIEGVTRMRPTLLPGLLDAVRHNFNQGTRDVRLFEVGRVFAGHASSNESSVDGSLPREREALALVSTGGATEEGRAGATRELDFRDLKGALEAVFDAINLPAPEFVAARVKHLSEGQAALVSVGGRVVGTLGRFAEEIAPSYKFRQTVFVAEVDFSALLAVEELPVRYMPLARFPSVVRDISLLVDRRVTFDEIRGVVPMLGLAECRGVELVDVYEGKGVPEGKRSVTLRVEYRSDERTLRDDEVNETHRRIVGALEAKCGAQLRG
ncbi:MAG: phenylalanine--tRNA ligase subunit beta [Acidobacteriota bacterium]|nr:phenylalanine--tRNA ligase subunit beta [Acidobacteriota bacterium]